MTQTNCLKALNITKRFGNKTVLLNADIYLNCGEIHTILGSKGSGKTTLMHLLSGALPFNDGRIEIEGKGFQNYSLSISRKYGLQPLYENQYLMQELTVAENIFMGEYIANRAGILSYRKLRNKADEIFKKMDIKIDADDFPSNLTEFEKQLVQMARVYANNSKIVIADEIVSDFTGVQKQKIFNLFKDMAKNGIGVLYFTHVIEDAFYISDRITVLRNGACVCTESRKNFDIKNIIDAMLGCDENTMKCVKLSGENKKEEGFFKLSEVAEKNTNLINYLKQAIDFINENLEEAITPKMVADAVHLSSGYLMMLFKNHLGVSIMEYTYKQRIEKSKEILENSTKKISEVALDVGISNTQYFAVLFKKHTNMTPKEYRKMHST